jgi:hypothetical protein
MTTILNPKVRRIQNAKTSPSEQNLKLNAVPPDLNGKTVGFLDNGKKNFDVYLDHTEQLLRRNYSFTSFRRRKPVPIKGITPELFQEMVARCDVIITGSGD